MARDLELQRAFEAIDDSITSVLGYGHYTMDVFSFFHETDQCILKYQLNPSIQITHEWRRYFEPDQFVSAMQSMYDPISARLNLLLVVSFFESGLKRMMNRIVQLKKDLNKIPDSYKRKLKWAFGKVMVSRFGTASMVKRIPELCSDLDHARRLRNLFMHNNGLFNQIYEDDAIQIRGGSVALHTDFTQFKKDPTQPVSALISLDEFRRMAYSHIEFTHQIHDVLQKEYFGCTDTYGYAVEQKTIDWNRLLKGH